MKAPLSLHFAAQERLEVAEMYSPISEIALFADCVEALYPRVEKQRADGVSVLVLSC